MNLNQVHCGDSRKLIKRLADNSVHCIITSPPYYNLRDYGMQDQMGLENTPEKYIEGMVALLRDCRRVLRDDGTLWVNIGDSYAAGGKNRTVEQASKGSTLEGSLSSQHAVLKQQNKITGDLKAKDLIGIPWMLAFALRADGWYLRQDIIWSKPNPMPEPVQDRCTKGHEYVFLLSKNKKYYFDHISIQTNSVWDIGNSKMPDGWDTTIGEGGHSSLHKNGRSKGKKSSGNKNRKSASERGCPENNGVSNLCGSIPWEGSKANKRSVWEVATQSFKEAHFATFPEKLVVDMIKAGCPENGIVLDPFFGAGTTGLVARKLQRNFIGFELNPEYVAIAENRLTAELGMFR